jgi:WD40 repeat protein
MVRIWRVATGELIASLDGRSSWLPRVVYSADGQALAATASDNHVRLWYSNELSEAAHQGMHR